MTVTEINALKYEFSHKADKLLLEQFRENLVEHYENQIQKDHNILPKTVTDDLKDLKESKECKLLIRTLAEWMVLIELCKDLLDRVETYDISIMMAEMLDNHLEKGWAL